MTSSTGGKPAFGKLFEPVNIGGMTVKNRFAVPAMGTGFATRDGLVTAQGLDYYEARARGGAGLVIVECACVDFPRGIHASSRLVIDNDATLPGLSALAQAIKKHGARAIVQLHHAGRVAKSRITGFQPVAPSPIPAPQGEMPRELTAGEISYIVTRFARAAARAKKAGFDGIEVHAAHGYLLAQFLSPFSNQRQDRYGGSVENRARILVEVLTAIRKSVGADYPLWCRINGQEYGAEGGLTLSDAKTIALMVSKLINAISVSARGYGRSALIHFPDDPGALLPLAKEIKKVVTVPVIAVGRLNPEVGEKAIVNGEADMIALGRQSIADPEVPNKVLSGGLEDIRPCIACFHCADVGLMQDSCIACSVNAAVGREREYELRPAAVVRKIAIIGGGPAGMEAARVLSLRGHRVVLLEKEDRLGGQLVLAAAPPHKAERIKPLITYFLNQLRKLDVEIRLNTEAKLKDIAHLGADVVLLATGSMPSIPGIPGIDGKNVVTAIDTLAGKVEAGGRVVVIGGGATGCETAEFLWEKGKEVTVVEMLPRLAAEAGPSDRLRLLHRITALPITFLTSTKCRAIQKDGVATVDPENKARFIAADSVVLASGVMPNNSLFLPLKASGVETHLAGDCWCPGKIARAISDGARLGSIL